MLVFYLKDSVEWMCPVETDDKIVCITHTNEVQVYDCSSGDPVTNISRKLMAEAMMVSSYFSPVSTIMNTSSRTKFNYLCREVTQKQCMSLVVII